MIYSSKNLIALWVFSCLISLIFIPISYEYLLMVLSPLVVTASCLTVIKYVPKKNKPIVPYLVFFSISATSYLGFTQALTGSHAEASNPFLYGLSFYSASMAFYLTHQTKLNINEAFRFSNPLLLISGPIALFIKKTGKKSLGKRINYYLPFVIIGLFFFQIIGSPLTNFLYLIEKTDLVSVFIFAIIFEIFVYANFGGLSLIIYGIFGILGYKVPLNFKQPYSSSNLLGFWQGNHTSLSAVLKKLFYTPLRRHVPQFFALSAVFISSGLWHGMTTNFLIWGCFHAIIFWFSLFLLKNKIKLLPVFILILGVIVGRIIFIESDTDQLLEKLSFSYEGLGVLSTLLNTPNTAKAGLILGTCIILIEFVFQKNKYVKKRNYKHLRSPIVVVLLTIIGILLIQNSGGNFAVYGQR